MQDRKFKLRSEEVQEILSFIPHWIIRWGIGVIFVTILLMLLATWVIKYPDIIKSRIIITTQDPPVSVIARSSGKLVKLFVRENEFVKRNTYIAAIENPAEIEDVFKLKEKLEAFKNFFEKPDRLIDFDSGENAILGELQIDYSNFLQQYLDYDFFKQTNYYKNKIKTIEAQIVSYKDLNGKLIRQREILSQELKLAQKKYNNNKSLFEKGLVSEAEMDNAESVYLEKKYSLENAQSNIINNKIRLTEYQKTIMDLNQQYEEKNRELTIALQESYKKLQSQLALWEQKYILKAPADGQVSFFKFWSKDQFVNIGDEVITIVPNSHGIVGKVYLPRVRSGKVKVGQEVKIKFDGYPFNEFGAVEGKIESISMIARDNLYLINVSLPNGLKTTYNKTLEFKQEMQGIADIITEDMRLIERIFNQIRYIFTSSVSR